MLTFMPMKDIEKKEDLRLLVNEFYNKALQDELIGPVFKSADFSLTAHIPVMVSFWETILFDVHTYSGNPMLKHIQLNQFIPLKPEHFQRWLVLWEDVLKTHFKGERTDEALKRASSIAQMMQIKISRSAQP
ncbi:group III truncated hemoglobin [Pedobacter sp.]|jgi:hemoglobin|uniref:group III truncated hemoglobin n=1 Tax=Pedobacter sp. TaxID=1411316 RepID=UPI002D810538|nr:group III truncated hemoglobin [Pedobacter sp.]